MSYVKGNGTGALRVGQSEFVANRFFKCGRLSFLSALEEHWSFNWAENAPENVDVAGQKARRRGVQIYAQFAAVCSFIGGFNKAPLMAWGSEMPFKPDMVVQIKEFSNFQDEQPCRIEHVRLIVFRQ